MTRKKVESHKNKRSKLATPQTPTYKVPPKVRQLNKAAKQMTAKEAKLTAKICGKPRKPAGCMKLYKANKRAF